MRNGCFAQHTYCGTLPPTIWVTRHTPECFLTLFCSHFPTSLHLPFSHSISLIPVTFPLPRFTHNLCLLFWCRAFYHYFPLGIIAAGAMSGGYAGAAGGTCRWWTHYCTDIAVVAIVDVIAIPGCSAGPDDLPVAALLAPPSPSAILQPHLSTSVPLTCDAVYSWRVGSKLATGFQKGTLAFSLPFPFLSSIHLQIHSTTNLRPPTVSDSLFATCENVSISMTVRGRLLMGYRSEACHHTSMWGWWRGLRGLPWLRSLRTWGGKSRPCSAVWFSHGCLSLSEYFGVNTVSCTLN